MVRIAVFAPSYSDEIFLGCFQGLKSAKYYLESEGREIELCFFDNNLLPYKIDYNTDDAKIFKIAQSDIFDGIITMGGILSYTKGKTTLTDFLLNNFHGKPMVNCMSKLPGIPSVYIDNVHGINLVVDHLVNVHGFSRIAILNGLAGHPDSDIRRGAFYSRMQHYNLTVKEEWDIDGNYQVEDGEKTALDWIFRYENGEQIPEALVACNDDMAFGFISKFNEYNYERLKSIQIPAVCGFDNRDFCMSISPPITSVTHPVFLQSKQALIMLVRHIMDGSKIPMDTLIKPELIIRKSCKCSHTEMLEENKRFTELKSEVIKKLQSIIMSNTLIDNHNRLFANLEPLFFEVLLTIGQNKVYQVFGNAINEIENSYSTISSETALKNLIMLNQFIPFLEHKIREYNIRIREHRRSVLMLQEALHSITEESQLPEVLTNFAEQFNIQKAGVVMSKDLSPSCPPHQLLTVCMDGNMKYTPEEKFFDLSFFKEPPQKNKLFCGLQTEEIGFGYMIFEIGDNGISEAREIARGIGLRLIEFYRTRKLLETERYAGLGKLLHGFAHHINTPLGTGITAISIIENQIRANIYEKEELNIDSLYKAAIMTENNLNMIRDMVDLFKRLSVISEYHTWEMGNPKQLMDSALRSEMMTCSQNGVVLTSSYLTEEEPFPFPTDSIRFILHELIENAVKYAFLKKNNNAPQIKIQFRKENKNLIIFVTDNGIGISESEIARLFEPFNRLGKSSEGLGMGLFAVKRIISGLLGGTLEIEKKDHPGLHLKIIIPIPSIRSE